MPCSIIFREVTDERRRSRGLAGLRADTVGLRGLALAGVKSPPGIVIRAPLPSSSTPSSPPGILDFGPSTDFLRVLLGECLGELRGLLFRLGEDVPSSSTPSSPPGILGFASSTDFLRVLLGLLGECLGELPGLLLRLADDAGDALAEVCGV